MKDLQHLLIVIIFVVALGFCLVVGTAIEDWINDIEYRIELLEAREQQ